MIYFAIFLSFNQGQKAWQLSQKHGAGRAVPPIEEGKEFGVSTRQAGARGKKARREERGQAAGSWAAGSIDQSSLYLSCTAGGSLPAAAVPALVPSSGRAGLCPSLYMQKVGVWC